MPEHSIVSLWWNVRTLGLGWWLRCALQNAWMTFTGRAGEHDELLKAQLDWHLRALTDEFLARGVDGADICGALQLATDRVLIMTGEYGDE